MIKEAEYKKYQFHEDRLKDRVECRLLKHEWEKQREIAHGGRFVAVFTSPDRTVYGFTASRVLRKRLFGWPKL